MLSHCREHSLQGISDAGHIPIQLIQHLGDAFFPLLTMGSHSDLPLGDPAYNVVLEEMHLVGDRSVRYEMPSTVPKVPINLLLDVLYLASLIGRLCDTRLCTSKNLLKRPLKSSVMAYAQLSVSDW